MNCNVCGYVKIYVLWGCGNCSCLFFLIPDEASQCLFIANPAQEIRMPENDRIECINSDLQLRMMLIM